MIDLHCHILPGIDDGSQGLDDSIEMSRQAAEDGIEVVCATPHIRHDHDVRIPELAGRVRDLNAALEATDVTTRVALGGEVAEEAVTRCDEEELRLVSLGGGGRWILLEPASGPLSDSLTDAVRRLADRGFRSVIAHPERHFSPDIGLRLASLVERGALIQITAAYLTAEATAPQMRALAEAGLVHLLGSDAHSSRHGRPVKLAAAVEALRAVEPLGAHLDWVTRAAPEAILAGSEVSAPYPPTP
jgi:protein-tyrosine phosphatase